MEAKTDAADFTALEIQEESADMARRSVAYNHLEDKIKVVTGDIRDASNIFGASSFHVITTNPPYMIGTHGENSPSTAKAIARHEVLCTLDDILRESETSYAGRQILYGTPAVPAGGDHEQNGGI